MSNNIRKKTIEQKANEVRNRWGLTLFESIRLKSLLMQLNVLAVFQPMSEDFSGMAIKIADDKYFQRFMLINSNSTLGRQHFTICHELYHLFVQENFLSMVCQTGRFDKKNAEEFNADWFAAYFLLPEEGIMRLIPENEKQRKDRISLATILRIEQYFSCSRAALLVRLEDIGLISKNYREQFRSKVMRSALHHGYSLSVYKPGNHDLVIGNYGEIARRLYDAEEISESHYASLMLDIGIDVLAEHESQINEYESYIA